MSVRGFSVRALNSECVNSENMKGLHIGDGATYVHLTSKDYLNAQVGWDWDHVPGITVDPKATPLTCATTKVGIHVHV